MSIQGIQQPELIQIDDRIRLRKVDGNYNFALTWYLDLDTVYLVDGDREPYTPELLTKMYTWLNESGELYFIEALEEGAYRPIGDVTFWQEDMPIVIGDPSYRGKGVGRTIVSALVQRGRALGFDHLCVEEIYDWNEGAKRCFESVGFAPYKRMKKGAAYRLAFDQENGYA